MSPVSAQTDQPDQVEPDPETLEPGFDPYKIPGAEQPIDTNVAVPSGGAVDVVPTPPIIDIEAAKAAAAAPLEPAATNPAQAPYAPRPERSEAPLSLADRTFGGTGIGIHTPTPQRSRRDQKANPQTATLQTLPEAQAGKLSNLDTAFTLRLDGFDTNPKPLTAIEERGPWNTKTKTGEADLGEESGWELTIDGSALPQELTLEQQDRLRIYVHGDCNFALDCNIRQELPTSLADDGTLTVELGTEVIKAVGGPDNVRRLSIGGGFGGRAFRLAAVLNLNGFSYLTGDAVFFSAGTVAAGVQNDYTASAVTSLATWQVGLQTGHAETSYSVPIPPSIGPMPDVAFSYSSGTVDGMTTRTANQGGILGVGWSASQPVISRATRGCASSAGSTGIDNDGAYEGSTCLAYPDDPTRGFTLSMGGVSGRLVPHGAAGQPHQTVGSPLPNGDRVATYQRFVTETMNDLRILLVTQDGMPDSNRGSYDQWWEVTTSDGTLYVFGRDYIFKPESPLGSAAPLSVNRDVDTTNRTNSAQVIPVANSQAPCGQALCDTVVNWHLDQIIDANGNMATYRYWRDTNYYNTATSGTAVYAQYDRSVNLEHVDYGLTYGQHNTLLTKATQPNDQRMRVLFDFTYRTQNGTDSTTLADWIETPIDLRCDQAGNAHTGGTCEDMKSPTLFNVIRLIRVSTLVKGARGSFVTFAQEFPDPKLTADNPNPVPAADTSVRKMWLSQIQLNGDAAADVMPALTFTKEWLANRVTNILPVAGGSMTMPRIGSIKTELGGTVTYDYGQPHDREPSYSLPGSHDCNPSDTDGFGYIRLNCYMFQQFFSDDEQTAVILFNKWVVTSITEDSGLNGHSANSETLFSYTARPDWAYSEQWGFTATDLGSDSDADRKHCEYGYGCNYWNDYRGHAEVQVTKTGGLKQIHYFFTGMRDDRGWSSDITPLWQREPNHASITTPLPAGGSTLNQNYRRGNPIGTRTLAPGGQILSFVDQQYGFANVVSPTAEWPGSYRVTNQHKVSELRDHITGRKDRGEVRTFFDAATRVVRIEDLGLVYSTATSLSDDDVTTCIAYPSTTGAIDGSWIIGIAWKTAVLPTRNTTCNGTTTGFPAAATWMSGVSHRFDGDTTASGGTLPIRGNVTDTRQFVSQSTPYADWTGTALDYNSDGTVSTSEPLHSVPSTAETNFSYDSYGHVSSVDGPLPNDTTTTVTNAHWGVPTQSVTPNSQANGYSDLVTTMTYDTLGRLKTVKSPGAPQASAKFVYSLSNNTNTTSHVKTQVLRESGSYMTSYQVMDGFGRTVQTQSIDASLGQLRFSTQEYGQTGELAKSINPVLTTQTGYGSLLGYSNGAAGYVNGYIEHTNMPQDTKTVTRQRDVNGTQQSVSEQRTRGIVNSSNSNGREFSTVNDIRGNALSSTGPGGTTTFTYNKRNDLISINGPASGTADTITYNYDDYHTQLKSLVDPDLGTVTYEYDTQGRLAWQTDGNDIDPSVGGNQGNNLWINYSTAGQPVSLTQGSATGPLVAAWVYDNTGRSTSATSYNRVLDATGNSISNGTVTTTSTYDPTRGYANTTTWNIPGLAPQTISIDLRQAGGVSSITYPDGTVSSYTYDSAEHQTSMTHGGVQIGSLRGVPNVPDFNARGQLTGFNAGGPLTGEAAAETVLGYEAWSGLMDSKAADAPNGENLADFGYDWDTHGNLKEFADTTGSLNQTSCFTYDTSNQLKTGYTTTGNCTTGAHNTGPDPFDVSYNYSIGGNIASAYGTETVNGTYSYGGTGGVHAVNSAGSNSYSYSTGGNQTGRNIDGANSALQYDVRNRLIGITGAGADMSALYDAGGNRVKRTLDGEVTFYLGEGYEIQPSSISPLASATSGGGGTTTTTAPATTTTTAPATTTTTAGGGTTTTTGGGSGGPLAILFLVNNPASLTSTEDRINTHLTLDGHTVTLRDAGASEETSPGDLIIIAHDGGLGNKYKTQAVPIISLAPGNWDNLELVDLVDGSNSNPLGSAAWTNQMNITDDSHPMAGGLTNGTFGFLVSSKGVNYAEAVHITGLSPALVAETTTAGQYTLLGYTSGQTMANSFTAPERRVLLSGLHNGNAEPTTDGWVVFDAVVDWAANNTSGGGGGGGTTTTTAPATTTTAPATTTTTAPATTTTTGGGGGTTTTTSGSNGPPVAEEIVRISHRFNGQMIGVSVNGEFTLTVTDHLGSSGTNREADGTTTVQKYTPFGALRTSTDNALLSDWTFTGQTDDPGTGLVDYNARAYDPQLGRFIMADTVLDGLNRYTYVRNNPTNATDPTGHDWCPETRGGGCGGVREGDEADGDGFVPLPTTSGVCGFCESTGYMTAIQQEMYYDQFMWQERLGGKGRFWEVLANIWDGVAPGIIKRAGNFGGDAAAAQYPEDWQQENAARHAMAMAWLTFRVGADNALQVGENHESALFENQLFADVDMFNNKLGIQVGLQVEAEYREYLAEHGLRNAEHGFDSEKRIRDIVVEMISDRQMACINFDGAVNVQIRC